MQVFYHGHSGFSVRTEKHLLIFDYLGEGLDRPGQADRAIAFVSHSHGDHFHPCVAEWLKEGCVLLAAGDDVDTDGVRMAPGDAEELDGVRVETFGSTDQGVSFLVHADGHSIFHAGDLNFWHWRNESDDAYVREAEEAFETVLDTLRGKQMDLAFFPVDPRMGEGHEEGAMRFIEAVRPACFVPMHFWNQPEAALAMREKKLPDGVRLQVMTEPGETFTI